MHRPLQRALHRCALMARQVVHDHHVAERHFRYKDLRNIGLEPLVIDRAIERHRRNHAGHVQARDQCYGLAMAGREPHSLGAPLVTVGHVGGGPGLVDKREPLGIQIKLTVGSSPALAEDVGAVLLDRVPRFCV